MSQSNQSILQIKPGAIRQIDKGKVELQPLLAIAITGAAEKYTDHPFHTLAVNHSGFLDLVLQLKKLRDPIEHGDISDFKADQLSLENLLQRLIGVIVTLLPSIATELKQAHPIASDVVDNINQERLKAKMEIEKALGLAFVNSMSKKIKEQFVRAELMLMHYTNEKSIEIIKCLASIMQMALLEAVLNCNQFTSEGDIIKTAMRKIVESGFYANAPEIPKQISTVNVNRLYGAVQRASTTLGAHLLAIFLVGSESELMQLKNSNPTFVAFVANLIRLRGHGNKQQSDCSRDDMELLKNNVYKAIKIITEVFL